MNDKEDIEIAVDGFFGLITSSISIYNPALGIAAISLAPALSARIKKWLNGLVEKQVITPREFSRMDEGIDGMMDTLHENLKNNQPRTDSLFQKKKSGFCDADDIFEAMLNHIKNETEKRKAKFCGNFIGNIPYAKDLKYTGLMQYSRIICQLSYTELCIIHNFHNKYNQSGINCARAELHIKRREDPEISELLSELLHLRNLGIIEGRPPYNMGENIGNVRLSFYGIRLYELMRLELLDSKDVLNTMGLLMKIEKYM